MLHLFLTPCDNIIVAIDSSTIRLSPKSFAKLLLFIVKYKLFDINGKKVRGTASDIQPITD